MNYDSEKYFAEFPTEFDDAELSPYGRSPEGTTLAKTSAPALKKRNGEEQSPFDGEIEGQLTIDVFQTPSHIVIESTIAGVSPEDLDIDITNESVTIKGKREKEEKIKEDDYIYQECYWGRFSRTVILPQEVDPENSEAALKNGVLTIKLPKLNRQKTKKLKVHLD